MASIAKSAVEARKLAGTAREMLDHARVLAERSRDTTIDDDARAKARVEAEQWIGKAKAVAESALRLTQ